MKDKIIARLRQIGKGYELDKLPPALLKAVIESALPLIEQEIQKAESKAIQKLVNERFVAKVIKNSLEQKRKTSSRQTPPPRLWRRKTNNRLKQNLSTILFTYFTMCARSEYTRPPQFWRKWTPLF